MKNQIKSEYETQAEDFLKKTGTTFNCEFVKWDYHFQDDKDKRDIYKITLTRGDRTWSFNFGNSINASGEYFLFPSRERIHLSRNIKGMPNKMIKGFGLLNNGNSQKNKDFKEPTAYDVLAGITKNDPVDFENFCSDYGYDEDSRKAEKIYQAVKEEWLNVQRLFTDKELIMLQEIN